MTARLTLAAEAGAIPPVAHVVLFGAPAGLSLDVFGDAQITVVQPMMPDAAAWEMQDVSVVPEMPPACDLSVVFLPRAKAAARALVAAAMAVTTGSVLIDGQKTDGVESLLKDMRRRAEIAGTISKVHGKLFWLTAGGDWSDWAAQPAMIDEVWETRPGVFSADGIDPGSALLADALPDKLSGKLADLGAGWGYLSGRALRPEITEIHLVEAHHTALDCARRNITDPRARFHWADVTTWQTETKFDAVIMNPPFHTGRSGDPGLGQAFIATAARILRPGGGLWMVANRHLPYEQALNASFAEVAEIGGTGAYKLFSARARR